MKDLKKIQEFFSKPLKENQPQFKKGDKVTYLGHPAEITAVNKEMTGEITYTVVYDKGQGRTKASNINLKSGAIKPVNEGEKSFTDYSNNELLAYYKNTKDPKAKEELTKRAEKLKALSRTDINEVDLYPSLSQAIPENTSYKDFAMAVAQVLKDDYGSHNFGPFMEVLHSALGLNEAINEDKSFKDLETAVNHYEKGNPTYDRTKLVNIYNQLSNKNQENAKKKYPEIFGSPSVKESKSSISDIKVGDILKFKDGEDWKVMKVKDNVGKLVIKPHNEKAKEKNVSLEIDIDLDYLKKNLTEAKEELTEAYVPSNIKEFAKRKGVSRLVNTVAGWAEKVGKGIRGGTAIGYNYNTLVLDMGYQTADIYINTEDETIELYGEEVNSFPEFKRVFMDKVTQDQIDHDEDTLRREQGLEEITKKVLAKLKK